jgi:nucleoid-associated protein EbfC
MKDMMGLMKKVQEMQQKMASMSEEIAAVEVQGSAGGGMVQVVMSAKGEMKSIVLDPSLIKLEDKEILEDLILAACNDARVRAERVSNERMAELTKGFPLPAGMKLPF